MVESIVLVNKSLGTSLPINMATRDYVLENVDWGAIESSNKSYKFINQVGVYVTGTTLESRTISILGWVVADTIEDMKRRKKFLNSFVNPLQRIDLQYNEYRIEGIPETSIKYGSEMPENNEVMCKFLINLFCPDPMFYTQNGSYVSVANWAPKFKFPLIIPSGNYVVYGDTPQETGTLENPVELTGVSEFTVKNQLYRPELVRPLRRIGQVKDKLQTCFKSVYDKRIVISSADGFAFSDNAGNGYARFYKVYNSVRFSPIASDWLPGYAKSAYNATNEGVYSADSDAGSISIVLSIKRLIAAGATSGDTSTYLVAAGAIFAATPLTVCYQSTSYDGANGLDVCLTEYQTGFVELDGTEGVDLGNIDASADVQQFNIYGVLSSPNNSENAICSHFERANVSSGKNSGFQIFKTLIVFGMPRDILLEYGFIAGDSDTYTPAFRAYLAAQKAAGTPIQVAYQLATAKVYADDPLKVGGHGIIMGLRSPSTIVTITNTGTLPCGFIITFQASGTVENPKIIDINTQEYIRLSHTMQAGEVIRISTLDNNKTVRQIIGEDSINAFNFLDFANSTFLQLAVGINYLRYDADSGLDNLSVEFKFDPRYLEVQE